MSTEDLGTVLTTDPIIVDPTTATGDMLYRDAGGDVVELAVGADTEVLTLAGGLPSWAAPAGGGTTFYCILYKQAVQTIVGNGVVDFGVGSEVYDVEGFHDTGVNPERITVPVGGAGLYLFGANIRWGPNTSGGREVDIVHGLSGGGVSGILQAINTSWNANASPATLSAIRSLAEGDYLYVNTYESSSGSPQIRIDSNFWALRLQT